MNKNGTCYIGTSNVTLPGNKSSFPDNYKAGSRLHYYSSLFNSVEVNSSFYKTPLASTFKRWTTEVPKDFRFSVKLSKEFSHSRQPTYDLAKLQPFINAMGALGQNFGCLLIQFPGKISLSHFSEIEELLTSIQNQTNVRVAVEFRNDSWYVGETRELLTALKMTMVFHDHTKGKNDGERFLPGFIYIRLHGPTGNYRDSYTKKFLDQQFDRVNELIVSGTDVFIYFNNTIGSAYDNAQYLRSRFLKEAGAVSTINGTRFD